MAQTVTFFIDEFSVGFYCRALRNEEISTHHTFRSQRCLDGKHWNIFSFHVPFFVSIRIIIIICRRDILEFKIID